MSWILEEVAGKAAPVCVGLSRQRGPESLSNQPTKGALGFFQFFVSLLPIFQVKQPLRRLEGSPPEFQVPLCHVYHVYFQNACKMVDWSPRMLSFDWWQCPFSKLEFTASSPIGPRLVEFRMKRAGISCVVFRGGMTMQAMGPEGRERFARDTF